jgi:predicted RNA binding protein YcfA (HicA-like mRNA interferase family)
VRIPRDINGLEVVRTLIRLGFVEMRQTGSHRILRKESRTVVVPMHKPIKPGTLKGVIDQSGIDPAEIIRLLG